MQDQTFNQEQKHIKDTVAKVLEAKKVMSKSMDTLGAENLDRLADLRNNPETSGADFMIFLQQLHEKNEAFNLKDKVKQLEELEYLSNEPYFARIDIADQNSPKSEELYIGKFGYTEDAPVIIDWRAKVASLYYRYRYPQKGVKYEAGEKVHDKDLLLKRTFEIDEGNLIKYYNNDLQLDENEIILDKIQDRTGGVLEDIIETIQLNQLDIIEADPRKLCIVQGCVGSGKSTVAIHKLSHIFFNFPDLVEPQRAILVAKNPILVKYLATLFPKLGIFDINYKTLRDLIVNVVFREEMKIQMNLDEEGDISSFGLTEMGKFKDYLSAIHSEYKKKVTDLLSQPEFESFSSFVYVSSQSIVDNLNELIDDLEEELSFEKEKIEENPHTLRAEKYRENIKSIRKLISKVKKCRIELKDKTLSQICLDWNLNTKQSLNYTETLMFVFAHFELFGFNKYYEFQYCVVDEGQDFSVLEYMILDRLVQNGRFTILGDLNQSYLEEGLSSWQTIQQVVTQASNSHIFELGTNYRSTKQIIDYANSLLIPFTKDYLPVSINRFGKEPLVHKAGDVENNDVVDFVFNKLENDIKNLDKSIGIICFDHKHYELFHQKIQQLVNDGKIPAHNYINLSSTKEVAYIPKAVYLTMFENCKGLEFSKVYVVGMPEQNGFNTAKKAFVAATRAMNELEVYYL